MNVEEYRLVCGRRFPFQLGVVLVTFILVSTTFIDEVYWSPKRDGTAELSKIKQKTNKKQKRKENNLYSCYRGVRGL